MVKAEDTAKAAKLLADDAEKWRALMHIHFHSFKESVRAGATKLQKELPDILKKYGLDTPDVSSGDTVAAPPKLIRLKCANQHQNSN